MQRWQCPSSTVSFKTLCDQVWIRFFFHVISLQKWCADFVLRENNGEIHRNNLGSPSLSGRSLRFTFIVPLMQQTNSKYISHSRTGVEIYVTLLERLFDLVASIVLILCLRMWKTKVLKTWHNLQFSNP